MANATLPVLAGFLCNNGNYLSQESFGNTLNASGQNMRRNQIFSVETLDDGKVALKSPKGTYVQAVVKGEVTCEEKKPKDDCKFDAEVQADGSYAFKSAHNYYLCSKKAEQMYCHSTAIGDDEKFKIHLAMHPQITIYSEIRKSYVHLKDNELQVNEKLPWGYDAMVTCDFDRASAKYTIRAANGKYWSSSAKLMDAQDASCEYVVQLVNGKMCFKGSNGKYLSAPTGKNQIFHCEGATAGTAEQFRFEDSHGQVSISNGAGKFITVAKGDPTGTATAVTDAESFQMEINKEGKWAFRTHNDQYFKDCDKAMSLGGKADATYFDLTYDNNKVKISSGGFDLGLKPNGNLVFSATGGEFYFDMINRPQMILRTVFGYVTAGRANDGVACNAASPFTFSLESKDGNMAFKAPNGKYVASNADGSLAASSDSPEHFAVEWRFHTKFAICCIKSGNYLKASQDGKLLASARKDEASLFEY